MKTPYDRLADAIDAAIDAALQDLTSDEIISAIELKLYALKEELDGE